MVADPKDVLCERCKSNDIYVEVHTSSGLPLRTSYYPSLAISYYCRAPGCNWYKHEQVWPPKEPPNSVKFILDKIKS